MSLVLFLSNLPSVVLVVCIASVWRSRETAVDGGCARLCGMRPRTMVVMAVIGTFDMDFIGLFE